MALKHGVNTEGLKREKKKKGVDLMRIEIGDVVRIITPFPNGCSAYVFNEVGSVTEIIDGFYRVKTIRDDFLYDTAQIIPATKEEVEDALREFLGAKKVEQPR